MGVSSPRGSWQQSVEYVDFGSPRRPGRRRVYWLVLACLLIGATVIAVRHPGRTRRPARPPVTVSDFGHRLLGIRQGWELFGLDSRSVVAIQLARGRVVQTALPPPIGDGPVSFIVGPRSAIVRPEDNVPGYLVPETQPARPLTGILAHGGLLLPGPHPGQVWDTVSRPNSLVLVGADGRPTTTRITLPSPNWPSDSAMSDGRGDVLVASNSSGTQYDAGPNWLRPAGVLLTAVGPSRWLGMTCTAGICRNVVVNPVTGSQQKLPGPPVPLRTWPWPEFPGSVAPDGLTAAVVAGSGNGQVALEEISLVSGAVKPIAVPIDQNTSSQTMAWSPDSKWLFVLAASGKLLAVNSSTGKVQSLGIPLPRLSQLAIRA
ncbi:MAG TPA: hypothetical protein VMA73_23265 [Streptosporangiaceae bacterium]|nr:hypothetical protein [Streptosporangiaceae bacterium]